MRQCRVGLSCTEKPLARAVLSGAVLFYIDLSVLSVLYPVLLGNHTLVSISKPSLSPLHKFLSHTYTYPHIQRKQPTLLTTPAY
jgi:hypothetical protein